MAQRFSTAISARLQIAALAAEAERRTPKAASPRYNVSSPEKDLACPYFVPREIVYDISWPHPARLPLGAGWTGSCCAGAELTSDGDASAILDPALLRDNCNLGYAIACPHLPRTRDWDAIRFSVGSSSADQVTLLYICEREHAPMAHGTMTYDLAGEVWRDSPSDPRVRRLASSFLQAYRVRQSPALI